MDSQLTIQKLLQAKLAEQQSKNPRYSLRAYSKKTGVHFAALSSILNGKRNVSRKLAQRIAERLYLDPQERAELLSQFAEVKSVQSQTRSSYIQLNTQQFRVAAEWEHFAVLSLLQCQDFQSTPAWIAQRLGLTEARAKQVIERLIELQLLTRNEAGTLTRSAQNYRTPDDMADLSIKRSHEQSLELAKDSLYRDGIEKRDFTTVTIPVNPKKLSTAKELIRKFQDDLCDMLEQGERTEVYRLSVQLFPLTKLQN